MQHLMCAQRSVTHISRQIIDSIITRVYYITYNKTESSHKCSGSIKKRSLAEAPNHRDVNWLTTSLVFLRKIIITIYYPSRIFIQIMKINKYKYMSYSTSVTWASRGSKGLTQAYQHSPFSCHDFSIRVATSCFNSQSKTHDQCKHE